MMKNGYVNGEHDGKAIESGVASGKSNNKPISVTNHKRGHFTQTYLLVSGVINPHWGWFTIGFATLRHSRIYCIHSVGCVSCIIVYHGWYNPSTPHRESVCSFLDFGNPQVNQAHLGNIG